MKKPFDPRRYADTLRNDYPRHHSSKVIVPGAPNTLIVLISGVSQVSSVRLDAGRTICKVRSTAVPSAIRTATSRLPGITIPFGHSSFRPLHFAKPGTVSGFPSADSFNIYRKPLASRQDVIPRDTNPGRPIILQGERPDTIRLPPEFQVFGGRPPRIRRQQLILVKVVPSVLPGKMLTYQSANVIR